MVLMKKDGLTKYEKARVIGARALQLAMGAPPLIGVPTGEIDARVIAKLEFEKNVVPLQVVRG